MSLRDGLLRYFSEEQLKRIEKVKVGIAGAGGLGSNCAWMLVRSGFKRLVIADFDRVEDANLNRQFFFPDQVGMFKVEALRDNLMRLNPELELETVMEKIRRDNAAAMFEGCDILVEAVDGAEDKKMLAEVFGRGKCFLVTASGIGGWGDSDLLVTRRLHNKFYLVGDNVTESGAACPPCAPRVNIAAGKQANLVLEYTISKE